MKYDNKLGSFISFLQFSLIQPKWIVLSLLSELKQHVIIVCMWEELCHGGTALIHAHWNDIPCVQTDFQSKDLASKFERQISYPQCLFDFLCLLEFIYLFPQRVQIVIILAKQNCVLKFKIWKVPSTNAWSSWWLALGSSLNLKTLCTVVFWKYPAPATFKFNRPNQWLLSGSHYFWMDKSSFLYSRCSLICIFTLS